jgi:hypothetical protein
MAESRYKLDDFELYRTARAFRKRLYQLIKLLPIEEKYCLACQMRRASRGSVDEILDDLNICDDEKYCNSGLIAQSRTEAYELIRKINGYLAYLRSSQQGKDD